MQGEQSSYEGEQMTLKGEQSSYKGEQMTLEGDMETVIKCMMEKIN